MDRGPVLVQVDGIDLRSTLRTIAFLPGDPTVRLTSASFERATVTPEGTGTVRVEWGDDDVAHVTTHGDAAEWLGERAPGLLGLLDDPTGFDPPHPVVRELWRRHAGDRIPRTGTLWHDLAWFIVQQRVTSEDAATQWRRLVDALGAPAPGSDGLRVPPLPETIARCSYHDLHRFGIERQRGEHLIAAARFAVRLGGRGTDRTEDVAAALASVPGVGPWTQSCVAVQTWGQPDAVIVGDDGIPSMVSWLLAGEQRADDARLAELLEPFRPHRHRVVRLAWASGATAPRRHHRGRRDDIRRR